MAGTNVNPHEPQLGTVDPGDVQDVAGAHSAGEAAAMGRREHYHQNILGQGANAGDLQESESTQQSQPTDSQNPSSPSVSESTL